ncbi:MAG: DUF4202 domain-containing protein [Planctomycetaceae bacterium]|nr:DUF4202 domain-containing protein [Planctomycetaceae bacterium]
MSPFEAAAAAIDRANAEDPQGREELYGRRMVDWVCALVPSASEELLLAARAQHLRRWTVPRSTYPDGRNGYLRWREDLKRFHADALGAILKEAGYGEGSVAKTRNLLVRKNLSTDAEGQTLEDAACLVFLQFELAEFAAKTEPDKMVDILRKSWTKMSPAARERALGLELTPEQRALVKRALEKPAGPG